MIDRHADSEDSFAGFLRRVVDSPTPPRWYAVSCKPRQEVTAETNLVRQRFEVYLPRVRVERLECGQRVDRVEPLFPRYLFVHADLLTQSVSSVRSTRGVLGMVRFGNVNAVVPDAVIAELMSAEDPKHGALIRTKHVMKWGDRVRVKSGPFEGLEGVYQESNGNKRATILLTLLGSINRVVVGREQIVCA